jgi:3,4-dihydroxy 2-butanone 4-phosphate synthase/GTP cyclohydrolase II
MISTKTNIIQLNTIKEAIADIKNGKMVIVVDDKDRENEGDFIAAAEMATPEMINFMSMQGRGLICAPITEDRSKKLGLNMMVENNTVLHQTQFTVSVDLNGHGCTTGISVHDRAKTIKALVNDDTKPHDLGRPGHIFPLRAKNGGVLRRTGHTEAAVDLARLAGFKPAGILVEILNDDGSMARLPQLIEVAKTFELKIISIEDLVAYRMQHDSLIEKIEDFDLKTRFGEFRLRAYKQTTNNQVHLALTRGDWEEDEPVLVRVNSTLINNDIIRILTHKPDDSFSRMFQMIKDDGKGAIVFINQENQSFNLINRLSLIKELQQESKSNVPGIKIDNKDFGIGAQILHDLRISKLRLITNDTQIKKRVGIIGYGLEIVENLAY